MRYMKTVLFISVLLAAFSCAKKDVAPGKPEYPVRIKNVDGVTVITNPDYPRDGKQVLVFEEELSIGVEEGDENYMLSWPFDVKVTDDGTIYVLDWKDTRIQVYDSQGKYLRTIGRKGLGPGEFDTPAYFDITEDGRVVLMDSRYLRLSILDANGAYLGGFKFEGYCSDMKMDRNNNLYYERISYDRPEVVGVTQEIEQTKTLYRCDLASKNLFSYGIFRGIKMMFTRTGMASSSLMISPYAHQTAWKVDRDGKLYAGYNEDYQLSVYDREGRLLFKFGRDFTPIKFEKYKGGVNPEYWSAFSPYMLFDEEGNLWLRHYGPDEDVFLYDIFSPDGIYLKQVEVPHRIYQLKQGKAYCIVKTSDDYRFVKRFRVSPEKS